MRGIIHRFLDQYLPAPQWRETVGINAGPGEVRALLRDPAMLARWFGGRWLGEPDGRLVGSVRGPFLGVLEFAGEFGAEGVLVLSQRSRGRIMKLARIEVVVEPDGPALCRVTILAHFTLWPPPLRRILGAVVSAWLNPKIHQLKDLAESRQH